MIELFTKMIVTLMYAANLGVLLMNTWMHDIPMMVVGCIVVSILAIFYGRSWWPKIEPEIMEIPVPYPVQDPYPADKKSHDYKMGYEDGVGDMESAITGSLLPAGHPANPGNTKKPGVRYGPGP